MSKYVFDSVRWLRNWSSRKRFLLADGRDPFAMCADEIHRLRMAVDLHEQGAELMRDEAARLKGELAALKDAVNWERECEHAENYINARDTKILVGARREWWDTYKAARAEVDRLIANESAAYCKGEGC